jgi:enamine deaminase RidA (YjgF/YER057c/UK114 family)
MPRFKLHIPGAWGEKNAAEYSYSQVMEIDGRVELSGQGGWYRDTLDFPAGISLEAEIRRAFDNVAFMLAAVGLDWSRGCSRQLVSHARR